MGAGGGASREVEGRHPVAAWACRWPHRSVAWHVSGSRQGVVPNKGPGGFSSGRSVLCPPPRQMAGESRWLCSGASVSAGCASAPRTHARRARVSPPQADAAGPAAASWRAWRRPARWNAVGLRPDGKVERSCVRSCLCRAVPWVGRKRVTLRVPRGSAHSGRLQARAARARRSYPRNRQPRPGRGGDGGGCWHLRRPRSR